MDINCKYRILIYGCGQGYNQFSHLLAYYKDIFEIRGIVTTNDKTINMIDGIECYTIDNVVLNEIDYIIVTSDKYFKEICIILNEKGIHEDKIIPSRVFYIPGFEFIEYISLKSRNVTILSNYCLAGFVYNELGLRINSPTINMICDGNHYIKFLKNYDRYLSMNMELYDDGKREITNTISMDLCRFSPKGIIDNEIVWNLVHEQDCENDIAKWNERRMRVNYNEVIATMIIQNDEEAYMFDKLPIERKIGFYYKDLGVESVFYIPGWEKPENRRGVSYRWHVYANNNLVN